MSSIATSSKKANAFSGTVNSLEYTGQATLDTATVNTKTHKKTVKNKRPQAMVPLKRFMFLHR
jgi:hypothetical protein